MHARNCISATTIAPGIRSCALWAQRTNPNSMPLVHKSQPVPRSKTSIEGSTSNGAHNGEPEMVYKIRFTTERFREYAYVPFSPFDCSSCAFCHFYSMCWTFSHVLYLVLHLFSLVEAGKAPMTRAPPQLRAFTLVVAIFRIPMPFLAATSMKLTMRCSVLRINRFYASVTTWND